MILIARLLFQFFSTTCLVTHVPRCIAVASQSKD